jgi:hypothetical protein
MPSVDLMSMSALIALAFPATPGASRIWFRKSVLAETAKPRAAA